MPAAQLPDLLLGGLGSAAWRSPSGCAIVVNGSSSAGEPGELSSSPTRAAPAGPTAKSAGAGSPFASSSGSRAETPGRARRSASRQAPGRGQRAKSTEPLSSSRSRARVIAT